MQVAAQLYSHSVLQLLLHVDAQFEHVLPVELLAQFAVQFPPQPVEEESYVTALIGIF